VIASVMVLTALALLISGAAIYARGHALTEQRVAADLHLVVDEFEALARDGLDRTTGQHFASADALLRAQIQRAVLGPSEGAFAIVGDRVRWLAQPAVTLRAEEDPDLVAHVLPLASADVVSDGRLQTALRDYRYVVVPVRFSGDPAAGALVQVTDLVAEEGLLTAVFTSYALVALGSLALVGLLIWVLVGRLLQPIAAMSATAARITDTDLSQRIDVRGTDDLSALGATVNGMLDRLETAIAGQRELLDDVGHELRTPLTIARGHLELMDAADAGDVAATRTLVLDEVDRMRRLVDDLLTLARAEQPDFLARRATDIARLTDETLAKATGLGPRHWVLDSLADTDAVVDAQRIAQAWLQLAANAVQYSAEGSTVGMGSALAGDGLRLWVRDEGVGIAEADTERVLQRLQRGSGASGLSAGTGLGLAIVGAITSAHGGRLEIDSTPGRGTRVTMLLPVTGTGPTEGEESE
jgi:signal transduction histidine kinase